MQWVRSGIKVKILYHSQEQAWEVAPLPKLNKSKQALTYKKSEIVRPAKSKACLIYKQVNEMKGKAFI